MIGGRGSASASRRVRRSVEQALADDLGARAQPLVRQRLPGRELDDLGVRRRTLASAPRSDSDSRPVAVMTSSACGGPGLRSALEQPGEQRRAQAVDEREVGVATAAARASSNVEARESAEIKP